MNHPGGQKGVFVFSISETIHLRHAVKIAIDTLNDRADIDGEIRLAKRPK
jgi:hypothetical protein